MDGYDQHTPGHWYYIQAEPSRDYMVTDNPAARPDGLGNGTVIVATVHPVSSESHHESNARLIAAAPDLAEACGRVLRAIEWAETYDRMDPNEQADTLRCALTRAGLLD
jgi:hypothetical protein